MQLKESAVVAVVVAHNSAKSLPECLQALAGQVPVVVVDNASSDGSVEAARQGGAFVILNTMNEGYGRANNQGVCAAENAQWCLILNPDAVVDRNCLSLLLRAAERNPGAAAIAPRLVEPDGRVFVHDRSILSDVSPVDDKADDVPGGDRLVHFVSGACLLVRREVFLSIGGFDARIFLFYEDDDLCLRLRKAGFKILQVDDAVVRHARGSSSEPTPGRIFRSRWHQAWSRSYVCRKHGVRDDRMRVLVRNGVKLIGVLPTLNRRRIERYAGSAAGAWARLRNRSALEQERLQLNAS
ncbi:MAG TPA: glycosyltransferase family 2 protein [Hyphomicrobiaceae bacterium]|nr:glycosyltransferase family 2 protein [Hyphomicrobiaceae bacterium]